jgi:Tannase and feruloyl esterase
MVPGMDHCGINKEGPGISDTGIDPLTALEEWVEHGRAPDEMLEGFPPDLNRWDSQSVRGERFFWH